MSALARARLGWAVRTAAPALAIALLAGSGWAAEGEEAHADPLVTLLIALGNFAVLLFVLKRYAGPAIQGFFFQRSEAIAKQLEQAQTQLRAAEGELAELRARVSALDADAERLRAEQVALAEAEGERALARAEETGQRIREDTQRVADREIERARQALRAEAADLAAKLAADLLREQLRPDDQQRLVDEFIERASGPAS